MKRLNKIDFLERAHKIHGDKYDYSKIEYKNTRTKVCIICPEHGEFWQTPNSHLSGQGCPECGLKKRSISKTLTLEEFLEKARKVHGDKYDYSKVEYVDSHTKICIICPEHGEFWQTPASHLFGHGCKKCGFITSSNSSRKGAAKFIKDATARYGDKYDYSKVIYKNAHTKVCIICPEHGEFWQEPNNHLRFTPKCCKKSKLEEEIRNLLSEIGVEYEEQKTFDWLVYKKNLYLDFFLPKINIAIECQGEQHFVNFRYKEETEDTLRLRMERDRIKNELCSKNGVEVIYFGCNRNHGLCCNKQVFFDKETIKKEILKRYEKSN